MPKFPAYHLAAAALFVLAPLSRAQQPAAAPSVLAQLTPEESKAAGLGKLSAAERASLDAALNRYLGVAVQKSTEQAVAKAVTTRATVTESRVAGTFRGLSGHTRIALENGQVWQQANTDDKFQANIENPDVIIVTGLFGNAMRVGGINGKFYVKQITTH